MRDVKVLILRTAGTNCDVETAFAFELAGAKADRVHVNRLFDGKAKAADYDVLVIPGGFSYGDDIAAGKILAVELMNALGDEIRKFVADKKPVLGICNGFQVLVKMGLLPNVDGAFNQTATLTANDSNKFEDRWVHLKCPTSRCIFTEQGARVRYPVAHAEGKFIPKDDALLDEMFENGQVVFQYVDENGDPGDYPVNPNGSPKGVAGVCDPGGTVLGLMPHPERHVLGVQHPEWTREGLKKQGDGLALFKNAVEYARKRLE